MPQENCPFLNIPGTVRSPHQDNPSTNTLRSEILGEYRATQSALIWISNYKKDKKIKELNLTQGLVNCANKILVSTELGNLPYIVSSSEYPRFKSILDNIQANKNRIIDLINLEETIQERVDHVQKSNALLLQFATKLEAEDRQAFSYFKTSVRDMVLAKIAGGPEFDAFLKHLSEEEKFLVSATSNILNGSFEPEEHSPFNDSYRFTMKGLKQIQIEKEKTNTNKVFIATAFHWEDDNATRSELMDAIKRACRNLGWDADVVSQSHTDYITDRILSEIKSSRFVIAELTYHNRGVYFESGYARGLGKNVFHLVREGFNQTDALADKESKRIHFDIQQIQYRTWNTTEEAENKLYDWINSTVGPYKNT